MSKGVLFCLVLLLSLGLAGNKIVLPMEETGPMTIGFVQGYNFDPLKGEPEIPADLKIDRYTGKYGYYLVQFPGPIREEWKRDILDMGGKFIDYQHRYTFLVQLDPEKVDAVNALPQVRWVGLFQPAYKLYPGLTRGTGTRTVIAVLFGDADAGEVFGQILNLGGTNLLWEINEAFKSVKFDIDVSKIDDVARIPGIYWIEPFTPMELDNDQAQWVVQKGYPPSDTSRPIWRKGLRGQGMITGTCDDGLRATHYMFRDSTINVVGNGEFPRHRKIIGYRGTYTSSSHGTHTCGSVCGDDSYWGKTSLYDGMAPKARHYFNYYGSLPTSWDMWTWWNVAEACTIGGGVKNMSMSLSRKDTYNIYIFTDFTADSFIWAHRQFLECNSMGNLSGNSMGHPPIAKDIISVCALGNGVNSNTWMSWNSRGPTADNRRKPTLCAPGDAIWSATSTNDSAYTSMSGTSMATPITNGTVTLIRQYLRAGFYPTGAANPRDSMKYISAALVKAMAVVSCDNSITGYTVPDNNVGWGKIDLDSVLYFTGEAKKLWIKDDTLGLRTNDSVLYTINVNDATQPFRVALVWTDPPGPMRANIVLVNNLDLTVIDPAGNQYKGSVYSGGQSVTGGSYDSLNVEECVRRNSPQVGTWTIKVKGKNVPKPRQPYALAVTGGFPMLGVEDVTTERVVQPSHLDHIMPNPAKELVSIQFTLNQPALVSLSLYDSQGRLIRKVIDNLDYQVGTHRVRMDLKGLAAGIYFLRLKGADLDHTDKIVLVK
ncbi:MAG: S8 family serine peptidase [candidate division WOR-3 bacterium]